MPSRTQYAQLWMYDNTTDKQQLFSAFRDNLAGTVSNTNMQIIDSQLSGFNDRIELLENVPAITTIHATGSGNNYTATVDNYESYVTDSTMILYLPQDNVGLTTININNLGVKSLMKINDDGTAVNLDSGDLRQNVGYLFQYDGTQFIVLGEKYQEVITSETQPLNQFTGGIWNKTLSGGGIESYVKGSNGEYTAIPPSTQAILVTFSDDTTVEAFKTSVNSSISQINSKIDILTERPNPNLLDNWYFVGGGSQQGAGYFPINQRGQTSYNAQWQYGIDRWSLSNTSSVSIIDNGLSVIGTDVLGDDYIFERLKNFSLHQTHTLSALFEDNTGTVKVSTAFGESSQSTNAKGLVSVSFPFDADQVNQDNNFVRFHSSKTATLIAAKLELGSVQTLAHQDYLGNWVLNEIPNFAEEYSKCTKYDLVTNNFSGLCVQGAGGHNSVYRGLNLGSSVTDEQWSVIQDGTFDNLYIGDYWVINGTTYRIAAFDYYWQTGDISSVTKHHVTIVPDGYLANQYMNPTNTTEGGYVGSYMYTDVMPTYLSKVQTDFGASHILTHREVLSNSVDATKGTVNGYAWYDYQIGLMTEQNVYGNKAFGDTPMVDNVVSKIYTINRAQYPLFRFNESLISNRTNGWTWLRNVVNSSSFASAASGGHCAYDSASYVHGVRPAFSIFAR